MEWVFRELRKVEELLAEDQWPGFLLFYTVKGAPYGLQRVDHGPTGTHWQACNHYVMMVGKKTRQTVLSLE